MKRYILSIIIITFTLFSCKKDRVNTPQTISKQHKVSFNVSGFSQTVAPFIASATNHKMASYAAATDTLAQHIDVLYFLVYNSDNLIIRSIPQLSKDANFGSLNLELDPGSYSVVIAGGKTGLQLNADTANQFVYSNNGPLNYKPFKDTFFKKLKITVGTTDTNYNVQLDRVVAQIEVNVEDAIPSNAQYLNVLVHNDCGILRTDGTLSGLITQKIQLTNLTSGTTNTKIFGLVLNTVSAVSVDIQCVDQSNNIIAEKTVTGVHFKPNKTTLLTGDLFGSAQSGGGVNVNYNPAWKVTTINYSF